MYIMFSKLNMNFIYLTFLLLYSIIATKTTDAINSGQKWSSDESQPSDHYFIYNSSETIDVQKAVAICRQRGLHLLSVHNKNADNYLVDVLTQSSPQLFWIRLSNLLKDNSIYGLEGKYNTKHEKSRKNSVNKLDKILDIKCVTIDTESGLWTESRCLDSAYGFMCSRVDHKRRRIKKIVDPIVETQVVVKPVPTVEPQPEPKQCNISGQLWDNSVKYGDFCYLFMSQTVSNWAEAEEECQRMSGSNLASIVEPDEQEFIASYAKTHTNVAHLWIGLFGTQNSSLTWFEWTDGQFVDITIWAAKQPIISSKDTHSCVFMDRESGQWSAGLCSDSKPFICKTSDTFTAPEEEDSGREVCPQYNAQQESGLKWVSLDKTSGSCYLFSSEFESNLLRTTWAEASDRCQSLNASLMSVHSYNFDTVLKMTDKIRDNTWIGLHETDVDRYEWDDESAVDLTYWADSAGHDTESGGKKCVSIRREDMKWSLSPCFNDSHVYDFICETRKGRPSKRKSPSASTPDPTSDPLESDDSDGWDVPQVLKICFTVLGALIAVSIAVNVYFFARRRQAPGGCLGRNRHISAIEQNGSTSSTGSTESVNSSDAMDRRRRFNDILNSNDPEIVFSNIKLKK